MHWRDLAGVEEGNPQESEHVDEVVEIKEEDRRLQAALVIRLRSKTRERDLAQRHRCCGAEHQGATSEAVDSVAADDAAEDDDELRGGGQDVGGVEWVAEI